MGSLLQVAVAGLLAGCSFDPARLAAVPGDAPAPDGPPIDTPPSIQTCAMTPGAPEVTAPPLGGPNGSPRPPLTCPGGELAIGLAFDVSQNPIPNHNNQIAMVNVYVRCGHVDRGTDGVFRSTPTDALTAGGLQGNNCSAYTPTVATMEFICADGSVLVGLTGNRLDDTLYNSVGLVCATVAADGTITTAVTNVPILGTGTETNQPQTASCPADTAITGFDVRSGCGHDQLVPRCAPVACQ